MTIPITVTGSVVLSGSMESTGSISNVTASYIAGSDVDGAVALATAATSASHALQADNAASADSAISASHALAADAVEYDNVQNKPDGLVSSSAQVITVLDAQAVASGGADVAFGTISGSSAFLSGDLSVEGTGSFAVFETIYVTSSIIEASGSTKFGDTSDDVHERTGSMQITAGGYTGSFQGDGSQVTGVISASHVLQADNADTATSASHAVQADNASEGTGSFTGSFIGGINLTNESDMSASQFAHERVDLGAQAGDFTISFAVGNVQRFEATADLTFAAENLNGIGLVECQNSGAFDVTLPSALWDANNIQTTASKATGSIDVWTFYQAGSNLIGSVMARNAS